MSGGGFDPSNMQSMMNNPSMANLMKNPDMIKNALNMLKDPNNKGMLDMVSQQYPGMNMNMVVKGLDVLVKCTTAYQTARSTFQNKFFQLFLFGLVVLFIAYYFSG